MGEERIVQVAEPGPDWATVRNRLSAAGHAAQMRMIDNMPAFPDEEPEPSWRELRVTLGHGMITIRRELGMFRLITWGNADEATVRDQEAIAQAIG
jgi:hypothetical protein